MKIVNLRNITWDTFNGMGGIYCGRGTALGNPYKEGTREENVANYRVWLWQQIKNGNSDVISALNRLSDNSILGCWCTPLLCHCEIIVKAWYYLQRKNEPT